MAEKKVCAYVMRHGTTILNEDNVYRGMLDPPLDEKGLIDAHKAAEWLKNKGIEQVNASPLLRTIQTAEIVVSPMGGRCITQCRDLFPWQVPELAGQDRDENADVLEYYIDHPKETPKNGESLAAFTKRVGDFFESKLNCYCVTLFVCHTSNIVTLNDLILGTADGRPEEGEIVGPGGVVEISEEDGKYSIRPVFGEEQPAEYGS